MFDTFGFPYDLTMDMLKEENLKLDVDGVYALRQFQKNKFKTTFSQTNNES
jgi:alanyl-tRNA synthetase